ncbi:peptide chain release factor 2 [Fusibacter sp. A1]|uniref:peptide chain release factor 2 n=1 Tax=Fusibacter sp. A1 TaxID=2283630 RepID=UPI00352BF505
MLTFERGKQTLKILHENLQDLSVSFDSARLKMRLETIEAALVDPSVWSDQAKSTALMREQKDVQRILGMYESLVTQYEELEMLCEMALEEEDDSMEAEFVEGLATLDKTLKKARLEALLSGEYDKQNAILSIHAGSGGLDANDWAEMLYRMYLRWGERRGFKVEILDYLKDDTAGLKSATIRYSGPNAYGFLKSEKGVHRIVRISPFDSSGRRHTSFAAIDVIPELDDEEAIDINPVDLRIDTFRSGGAGGQHVNTTDSAVRIVHLPTGVVVQCQNERSQIKNRATAMKMLMAKLIVLKEQEHKEKIEDIQGDFSQISWGSQIRSYVFHPYQLVKDHRTGAENGQLQNVMDGDIDLFIDAYLIGEKSDDTDEI